MITPAHILDLLTYAAKELVILAETDHNDVSRLAQEIADRTSDIRAALKRARVRRDAEAINRIVDGVAEAWEIAPENVSNPATPTQAHARWAAVECFRRKHGIIYNPVAQRLGVGPKTVSYMAKNAQALLDTDEDFRQKYNRMLELLSSGDGHSGEVVCE